ncbi:uncharacterized protein LOC126562161 [Anopheles maculipalpis]|uniref:uncharacterized protein LOC126562161 n=1 Tax=Anopheles maculipalpis TaxID=1496333 RepID=UPI0021596371|nr:uncharacterized protein LOC126562161 [Anopheles maculipalpis]
MPNSKCAAAFCRNKRAVARDRKLDIIFHSFPVDDALRRRWIQFCRRGDQWTPYKTDSICSAHFRKQDYQMANSPRTWSKNLRRLNHDAFPSIMDGSVLTISKKQKLDKQTHAQLVEELYHKTTHHDVATERDHTYSGVTAAMEELEMIVYRLQKFPDVCACCFKTITDEKLFTPFAHYCDELECTIEQKLAEITGMITDEIDHANVSHPSPDKVCEDCLEALVAIHQYQRQLQCMRKFCNGMTHLLRGNREPLATLYGSEQRSYLVHLLQCLNVCQGPEDKITLERLEQEVATYGRMKKGTVYEQDHPPSEETQLEVSNDKVQPKRWICPYEAVCREWFLDEAAFLQHVRDDHKVFKCRTCGSRIKFYDLFKKHIDSHAIARALLLSHNSKGTPRKKELKCGTCSKDFKSENLLKQHEKASCTKQNYVCGACLTMYACEDNFNSHTCSLARMKIEPVYPMEELDGRTLYQEDYVSESEDDSRENSIKSSVSPNHSSSGVEFSIEILR